MKQGMILFAAVIAAVMFASPTISVAVDTTQVDALSNTVGDAGADVAVDRYGNIYVSALVNGTQFQVTKGVSGGTFSNVIGATASGAGAGPHQTAMAVYGPSDSPVLAVASDTCVGLYISDTGTTTMRLIYTAIGTSLNRKDTRTINAIDMIANDSYVVLAVALGGTNKNPTTDTGDPDSGVLLYTFRVQQCNSATLEPLPMDTYAQLLYNKRVVDLQVKKSVVRALNVTTDTGFAYYVLAVVDYDFATLTGSRNNDSGIKLSRVYQRSTGLIKEATVGITPIGLGLATDSFTDAAMTIDQENGSDTIDRITILAAPSTPVGAETLALIVLEADSNSCVPINCSQNISGFLNVTDTVVQLDTGLKTGTIASSVPGSLAVGRAGNALAAYYVGTNGALYRLTSSVVITRAATTASAVSGFTWSVDTIGTNTGYVQNNVTADSGCAPDSTTNGWNEISQILVSNVLYVVGQNRTNGQIWYMVYPFSSETKKKDSGVCLMDRLFGRTSLRAAFPAMKSFRDTLLGTDMGRKLVSLYYSF